MSGKRLSACRFALSIFVTFAGVLLFDIATTYAIAGCERTIADQMSENQVVVLSRLVDGAAAAGDKDDNFTFEVIEVLKGAEILKKEPGAKSPYRFTAWLPAKKPSNATFFFAGLSRRHSELGLGQRSQWSGDAVPSHLGKVVGSRQ